MAELLWDAVGTCGQGFQPRELSSGSGTQGLGAWFHQWICQNVLYPEGSSYDYLPGSQGLAHSAEIQETGLGNSLAVQWLGLRASTAGGTGLMPGWGTKILDAMLQGQKKKRKRVYPTDDFPGLGKQSSHVLQLLASLIH